MNFLVGVSMPEEADQNEAVIERAERMISLINLIKVTTSPMLASLTPEFAQIAAMIDQIIREITEILNSNLSPAEKNKQLMSLNSKIMEQFTVVIGLLSLVAQKAMTEKAKHEATMSEATNLAAQMGVSNSQAQAEQIVDNLEYLQGMSMVMEILKYTMMAILVIAAPGIGSMLIGVLFIALEASGVLEMASDAIAEAIEENHGHSAETSQLIADFIICGLEIAFTMGAGAALDAALKVAMKRALASIAAQSSRAWVQMVRVTPAAATADEAVTIAAEANALIETAGRTAAKEAAKKVFTETFKQHGLGLAWQLLKKRQGVYLEAMEAAALDAAKDGAKKAQTILNNLGNGFTRADLDRVATQLTDAATEAGNAAAANAMGCSLDDIATVTVREGFKDGAKVAGKRAGWTALYTIGANNVLVDFAELAKKEKWFGDNDKTYEVLAIIMQVLQAILMLIAQIGGTGGLTSSLISKTPHSVSSVSNICMKVGNAVTPVATATEGAVLFSQYHIQMEQADVVKKQGKLQTALDVLLQMMAPMIEGRGKEQAQNDSTMFSGQMKSNAAVASHVHDYLHTASEVMISG